MCIDSEVKIALHRLVRFTAASLCRPFAASIALVACWSSRVLASMSTAYACDHPECQCNPESANYSNVYLANKPELMAHVLVVHGLDEFTKRFTASTRSFERWRISSVQGLKMHAAEWPENVQALLDLLQGTTMGSKTLRVCVVIGAHGLAHNHRMAELHVYPAECSRKPLMHIHNMTFVVQGTQCFFNDRLVVPWLAVCNHGNTCQIKGAHRVVDIQTFLQQYPDVDLAKIKPCGPGVLQPRLAGRGMPRGGGRKGVPNDTRAQPAASWLPAMSAFAAEVGVHEAVYVYQHANSMHVHAERVCT